MRLNSGDKEDNNGDEEDENIVVEYVHTEIINSVLNNAIEVVKIAA